MMWDRFRASSKTQYHLTIPRQRATARAPSLDRDVRRSATSSLPLPPLSILFSLFLFLPSRLITSTPFRRPFWEPVQWVRASLSAAIALYLIYWAAIRLAFLVKRKKFSRKKLSDSVLVIMLISHIGIPPPLLPNPPPLSSPSLSP